MSSRATVLTGLEFGRLMVVDRAENSRHGGARWRCKCSCGNFHTVSSAALTAGKSKSCGCLKKESPYKHGMCGTRTYNSWNGMKRRCYEPGNNRYKHYGGRGISVCIRWVDSFDNFYLDMGERPEGKTLDRINSNKNYYKGNCRWATSVEQARNKRTNRRFAYKGKTLLWSEWSFLLGGNSTLVYNRVLTLGWNESDAVTRKVRRRE